MKENVLQFPKSKIVREIVPDNEEIQKMRQKSKSNLADTIVEDLTEKLLLEMADLGIDTEGDDFIKDFHFLVGVLSATIYRTLDLEHPFHGFLSESVQLIPITAKDTIDLTD